MKYLALIPLWVLCIQLYFHAVSRPPEEKQAECRVLGILFTTVGIGSLVFRTVWLVFSGLAMIMVGLRLMAHSLDRINKSVYIDRYKDN
jgi:hypothetical protein